MYDVSVTVTIADSATSETVCYENKHLDNASASEAIQVLRRVSEAFGHSINSILFVKE
jgi:hypothetical protein